MVSNLSFKFECSDFSLKFKRSTKSVFFCLLAFINPFQLSAGYVRSFCVLSQYIKYTAVMANSKVKDSEPKKKVD